MAKRPRLPRTLGKHLREPVRKYAVAVGELVWASNDCLNYCALIYRELFDNDHINIAVRSWHLQRSDAAQRDLLVAAIKGHRFLTRPFNHVLKEELLWAISKVEQLAGIRNDAVHSATRFNTRNGKIGLITSSISTLPKRVERLSQQRSVIKYFNSAKNDFLALTAYLGWLWLHLRRENNLPPLPHRPKLRSVP